MAWYALNRLLLLIPVMLGVSLIAFLMIHLTPGDPARLVAGIEATDADVARVRESLGLDQPLYVQYTRFLTNAAQGDLGRSIRTRRPVLDEVLSRYPTTLILSTASVVFAVVFGVTAGVLAATRPYSWLDRVSMIVAILGISVPSFYLGLLLLLVFSVQLGWFPMTSRGGFAHFVLPTVTLGLGGAAIIARLTRSSMLEVLRQDYVRVAHAKGLAERVVVWRHALKNALIPTVTIVGLQFGTLLGGAVVTENVFALPGVGRLVVESILTRDFPIIQAAVLLLAVTFAIVNFAVDLTYAALDPRIRYG
ncbi:MAG: ABC transporter permease [Chloroflexi bacterium]|nr:ABC transporter permease [Chloroflexota bacterium]